MSAALSALRLDDAFATPELPLSGGGAWAALAWDYASANRTGQVTGEGWGPYDPWELGEAINGAYWTKASFADTGSGDAVAATLKVRPGLAGRHFELLLNMPTPASARSGYELRFTEPTGGSGVYTVTLVKWVTGTPTTLASQAGVSLAIGGRIGLVHKGGTLSAWVAGATGEFTQLLSAGDTTYVLTTFPIQAGSKGTMSRVLLLKKALVACGVALAVTAGPALAADPTDTSFGTNGIAEIEARFSPPEALDQVGGIADLAPTRGGKMLAAVYPIARGGQYFAAARIGPDGSLDRSFGRNGFTAPVKISYRKQGSGGVLQAEAVAAQRDGKVLLAGYYENGREFAPAVVRFTSRGRLDPGFGRKGKVIPNPSFEGRPIGTEGGGERLRDVALQPDGTIVSAGDIVAAPPNLPGVGPKRAGAVVIAYRPDGEIDRSFGRNGRFKIIPRHSGRLSGYTGFTEIRALPSGKLLVSGYLHQRYVLYRLTADGRIDRSFGRNGRVAFAKPGSRAIKLTDYFAAPFAVDPRGRIVLCVPLFPEGSEEPIAFVRLLPDGRRDRSFGRSTYMERAPIDAHEPAPRRHGVQFFTFEPQAIAIDGHGRVLVTGGETAHYTRGQTEPGHEDFTSRRFLANGRRDRSFGEGGVWHTAPPDSQGLARAALTQPDGKVVAGGRVQIERFGGNGPGNTAMMLTRYR